jgi:hypothetical protein
MAVTALIAAIADHLEPALPSGTAVGPVQPVAVGDVPAVVVSLLEVTPTMPAVGRTPAPVRVGALQVEGSIDLADPVLHFPGEDVALLSPDRRLLQLPHGGIVRADGSDVLPFGAVDLGATLGATTFTPVNTAPGPTECRPDPVTGAVTFGAALANTGTLTVRYFVGEWEVAVERYAGVLTLEAFAASSAATIALSDQVVELLAGGNDVVGVRRLDPNAVGAVVPAGFGAATRRSLTYRFDYEHEVATIRTSGGPIRSVAVDAVSDATIESFTVTREGN